MGSRHTKVTAEDSKDFVPYDKATLLYCQSYAPITDPNGNARECPNHWFQLRQDNDQKEKPKADGPCDILYGSVLAGMHINKDPSSSLYGFAFGHPLPDFGIQVPIGCIPTTLTTSLLDENDQSHLVTKVSYDYQKMDVPSGQVNKDELNSQDSSIHQSKKT